MRMRASYLFRQLQHAQQFLLEILLGCQRAQAFLRWPFQVYRDAICQLHRSVQLIVLHARHDLEMNIALVVVLLADNLDCVDDLVLGGYAALDDPR